MVEGWVREDGSLSKGLKGLSDDSKTGHVGKSVLIFVYTYITLFLTGATFDCCRLLALFRSGSLWTVASSPLSLNSTTFG